MEGHSRYSILDTLGTGAYATVYRGFDRDLGREVAIKQIHAQYLSDAQRLDSYWREAHILARLHHPCVMTIFDIVRDRGWLVLELLEGSIQQRLHGEPIRIDDLRLLLTHMLHALHFLHAQGVIHGDIKPGNLLLDRSGGIKLGDFGIARRVHDDHGSVMKGTTRYIAPEVLSAQFGSVGPASDLYSLGFTAYELLCGKPFNTLFPELETFGRDAQMSWMMWHASRELRLPPVASVLDGVPADMAKVVDRLIEKDITKRYSSAAEALGDLQQAGAALLPPIAVPPNPADEAAARAKMRQRRLAVGALCASAAMSLGVAMWPTKRPEQVAVVESKREPSAGIVSHIDPRASQLFLTPQDGALPVRIDIEAADRILLNDAVVGLPELRPGDQVSLRRFSSEDGASVLEVVAWREAERETAGKIESIDEERQVLRLTFDDPAQPALEVIVPPEALVTINGVAQPEGRPLLVSDLAAGDVVTSLRYATEPKSLRASSVQVLRLLQQRGTVVEVQASRRKVGIELADGGAKVLVLEAHPDVRFTLNGSATVQGRAITIGDLAVGDQVSFDYDTKLRRLEALRGLTAQGTIKRVNLPGRSLAVVIGNQSEPVDVQVPDAATVEDREGRPVELSRVRAGDRVWFAHDSIDLQAPVAKHVRVELVTDPRAWALLVGQRRYDDTALGVLPTVERDIERLRSALVDDYRIPAEQLLVQQDATRDRLETDIPKFLSKVAPGSQLYVCFLGGGILSKDRVPVLAAKDTAVETAVSGGLALEWLIKQIEETEAAEKILLLDTRTPGDQANQGTDPATLTGAVHRDEFRGISRSVTVITACNVGEPTDIYTAQRNSPFIEAVASAFHHEADANGDLRVDRGELLGHVKREAQRLADLAGVAQTPTIILPDATPHRVSMEARAAIVRLLAGIDNGPPADVLEEHRKAAVGLAPDQPEPELAYGLVLLKANKTLASYPVFERVRSAHPDSVVAHQAIAWQHFIQRRYKQGIASLEQMISNLPQPEDGQWQGINADRLRWAGALRGYALYAADPPATVEDTAKLDQLVVSLAGDAKSLFAIGTQATRAEVQRLDAEVAKATEDQVISRLRFQRRLLSHYLKFDFSGAADDLKRSLEH